MINKKTRFPFGISSRSSVVYCLQQVRVNICLIAAAARHAITSLLSFIFLSSGKMGNKNSVSPAVVLQCVDENADLYETKNNIKFSYFTFHHIDVS